MRIPTSLVLLLFLALAAQSAIILTPERPLSVPQPGQVNGNALAAASDGNDFVVFWRSAPASVLASRVSAAGTPLDTLPRPPLPINALTLSAVWTGSSYLVVSLNPGGGISATTLARDATVLTPPRPILEASAAIQSLVTNGRRALLLYNASADSAPKVALLDADGTVVTPDVQMPFNPSTGPVEI